MVLHFYITYVYLPLLVLRFYCTAGNYNEFESSVQFVFLFSYNKTLVRGCYLW